MMFNPATGALVSRREQDRFLDRFPEACFKVEVSKSTLLDIQYTLLRVCGMDLFILYLPESEILDRKHVHAL